MNWIMRLQECKKELLNNMHQSCEERDCEHCKEVCVHVDLSDKGGEKDV